MDDSIYHGKDGRLRVYVRETKKTISYPKYLMQKELGRDLSPNEEVHHVDKNPLNNDVANLKVMSKGEHARDHMTKFFDTVTVCGWCGREFLWTGRQQQMFYSNRRNHERTAEKPFCSRSCSGSYGRKIQSDASSNSSLRKLTSEQVQYIRDNYKPYDSVYGGRALAKQFGVDRTVIDLIIKNRTYKNVL